MASSQQEKAIHREGRLALAAQAYHTGKFRSYRAAADSFDVSAKTLQRRIEGIPPQLGSTPKNRLLTTIEEEILLNRILSLARRGMAPSVETVRRMATLLVAQRNPRASAGKCWARNYINRQPELKSRYNRKYDYQRAQCEDPELIRAWFRLVLSTKAEYGILDDDTYNFDETGFQMGVISTSKVVTGIDRAGRPKSVQPGNREWVTVIEGINALGWSIPPLIILEAVLHQQAWYDSLPSDWSIGVSPNGWTNDEIGLHWLINVFDKHTVDRTVGTYRLLILDGHGSHITPEFDQYCTEHSIITLCMPPHSSHLLQPLDVGCFAELKRYYGQLVAQKMSLGVNHIDKHEFVPMYKEARTKALHSGNIRSGFAATGLVPYEPDRVLERLHTQMHTPSPQLQPQSDASPYTAATPHNITELQRHTTLIKQYIQRRTHSPPSPTDQALNQLVKGCKIAMQSAVLLVGENERLIAENRRQKKKRERRRKYIAKGGIFTGAEAQALITEQASSHTEATGEATGEARQRAPARCSLCNSLEHRAPKCPENQRIN
jgi:hypothetical protein